MVQAPLKESALFCLTVIPGLLSAAGNNGGWVAGSEQAGACLLDALPANEPLLDAGRARQAMERLRPFALGLEPGAWRCPKTSLLFGLGIPPLAIASFLPHGPLSAASEGADKKQLFS